MKTKEGAKPMNFVHGLSRLAAVITRSCFVVKCSFFALYRSGFFMLTVPYLIPYCTSKSTTEHIASLRFSAL